MYCRTYLWSGKWISLCILLCECCTQVCNWRINACLSYIAILTSLPITITWRLYGEVSYVHNVNWCSSYWSEVTNPCKMLRSSPFWPLCFIKMEDNLKSLQFILNAFPCFSKCKWNMNSIKLRTISQVPSCWWSLNNFFFILTWYEVLGIFKDMQDEILSLDSSLPMFKALLHDLFIGSLNSCGRGVLILLSTFFTHTFVWPWIWCSFWFIFYNHLLLVLSPPFFFRWGVLFNSILLLTPL